MRLAILVAITLVSSLAHARDGIVIEAYTGARPADASKTLEPLLTELAQRGFEAGDGVGRIYEGKVSRPRVETLPPNFAANLQAGQQAYLRGNFAQAMELLLPMIDAAHASSSAFAKDQKLRQTMVDALVALALAQDRNGDPKTARATLGELVRSFPRAQVSAATWGPAAAKLFAEVQRDLQQQSKGQLIIKAPSQAEVYINEGLERTGSVAKDVLPGPYRIFVREGRQQSRTYRVMVNPTVDTIVEIDLALDAAVRTSPWTGLEYATAEDRARYEAKHAAVFASAIDERAIVVVGIDAEGGRRTIVGALINLTTGRDERRASFPLEARSDARMQALARFLAGDPASPELDVQVGGPRTVAPIAGPVSGGAVTGPADGAAPNRRWGGWPIVTGALAAGAIGVGAYLVSTHDTCGDGSDDPNCPDLRNNKTSAALSLGGGAVLAAVTVYLIVTRPKAPSKTAYLVPTDGGALAGVSVRF